MQVVRMSSPDKRANQSNSCSSLLLLLVYYFPLWSPAMLYIYGSFPMLNEMHRKCKVSSIQSHIYCTQYSHTNTYKYIMYIDSFACHHCIYVASEQCFIVVVLCSIVVLLGH